jgi:stage V sporulation protein B
LQRYGWLSLIDLGRSLCFALGAAVLLKTGFGVVGLAWLLVALSSAVVLLSARLVRRLVPSLGLTRRIERGEVTSMARMSTTMFLLRVNAVIYGQMDKAILAIILSTEVLVHYDVTARFQSLALIAMGLVSSVVLSTSAALNATGDHSSLKRLFILGTRFSVACSLPVSIMLMVLARPLLQVWLGPAFVEDRVLVWLFLSYTLFWGLKEVGWNLMIGMGHASSILRIQLWTTAVNGIVSVPATYRFGVAGVLIGTLVGNAAAFVLYMRLYLPALHVSLGEVGRLVILPVYPQALLAGAVLAAACLLRAPGTLREVMVYAAGFGLVYAALFVTTGLSKAERQLAVAAGRGWLLREPAEAG